MFAKVILLAPPYSELTYTLPTYFPAEFWKVGMRVIVPMGGKKKRSFRTAFISAITTTSDLPEHIHYKDIFFPLELTPLLNSELAELSKVLGARQAYAPGAVYGHILPATLRQSRLRIRWRPDQNHPDADLSTLLALSTDPLARIARDLLSGVAYFVTPQEDEAEREICFLSTDPPWPVRPAAKNQTAILDHLHENGATSRRQILKKFGASSASALRKLISAGHIRIQLDSEESCSPLIIPESSFDFLPNEDQALAYRALKEGIDSDKGECRLLFGVTGSGKTAVYLELLRHTLTIGKSAFLLAPEVALAHKLYRDALGALPKDSVYLYHGYQTVGRRERLFREISSRDKPCVVIGSRSALFLPVHDPACIVLDEEHDSSFKQDESFAYHAREAGWFRASRNKGLLLLGSATPDLGVYQSSLTGLIPTSRLSSRVSGRPMPPMRLVDIAPGAGRSTVSDINAQSSTILAEECEMELEACLERGEQAIILLNRRGYAPLIFCVDCHHTLRCPHCEIGLAYHKNVNKLICHYCGYSTAFPVPCPDCGKMNFLPVGEGTEKLEERLENIARQPILRLDRDNVRRSGKIEEILGDFARQKSPFLVGTQMLSKGHHFPNVTLVLVADGDIGLNMPDYKAAERTFQLLVQAAGRAGRGERQGKVLIQTRNRSHYCWKHITDYDYAGFAAVELEKRKKYLYPPFTRLGMLRISFPLHIPEAEDALASLGRDLRQRSNGSDLRMLGPAPAPIGILRGQKRFQCLFKSKDWSLMRDMYFFAQRHPASKLLRLDLDLDPVNMM